MKKFKEFIMEGREDNLTKMQKELLDYVRGGGAGKDAEWIAMTLGTSKGSVMKAASVLSRKDLVSRDGNRLYPIED